MIVVFGSSGMLGRAVVDVLQASGETYVAFSRNDMNLMSLNSVLYTLMPLRPRAIFNCIAYTDVDAAETNYSMAFDANAAIPGILADVSDVLGAILVHFSTDHVFSGEETEPYEEGFPTRPINAYGLSKLVGESLIKGTDARHIIIRTSWLHASWGKNFVQKIYDVAKVRDSIDVVNDQRGRPTDVRTLAITSHKLLNAGVTGTFHVANAGECSRYEFAKEIVRIAGLRCTVKPTSTPEITVGAKRPKNGVLDISRVQGMIGNIPPWEDTLVSTLDGIMRIER